MRHGKRIILASRPVGMPKPENFSLEEFQIPSLSPGQVLVKLSHFSLDPYMRGRMDDVQSYAPPIQVGSIMEAGGVGRVEASAFPGIEVGDLVYGRLGWGDLAVIEGNLIQKIPISLDPKSLALGVLGMPGFTGWWGLNQHGRPKPGETLLVGAVTGPVGSMVAQLAKQSGLNTIGVAGSKGKCELAIDKFGLDHCLNHKDYETPELLRHAIEEIAPQGIDIYFENVGGKLFEAAIPLMNEFGRIPVCGMISWYNDGGMGAGASTESLSTPHLWRNILVRKLSVNGYIISDHWSNYISFVSEVEPMVASGSIKYQEDVVTGIENAPDAFIGLLNGRNLGKLVIEV